VESRVKTKILLLPFKAFNKQAPNQRLLLSKLKLSALYALLVLAKQTFLLPLLSNMTHRSLAAVDHT